MFVEIKNLSKFYSKYLAVNKINFSLEKNKTLGLLGPNGCGKTTTIAMILGLLKPSSGKVLINKKNIENHRINLCLLAYFIYVTHNLHIYFRDVLIFKVLQALNVRKWVGGSAGVPRAMKHVSMK